MKHYPGQGQQHRSGISETKGKCSHVQAHEESAYIPQHDRVSNITLGLFTENLLGVSTSLTPQLNLHSNQEDMR